MLTPSGLLTDGPRVAAFCHQHVRHTKGRWAGKPLDFEPWQLDFLNEAFEVDPVTGHRVYHEVLLGIPRKNGKSTMAAGIALYLLVGDGEAGPEVYAAAGARDQARVIFEQAREFVGASPTLQDLLHVRRYDIGCPENAGKFRVISSDARLQHGSNPSGNVIDELWAHRDGELYTALTSGTAAREQPFTLTITTAGWDLESFLGQLYTRSLELPELERRTPYLTVARDRANGFLFYWYGAPDDAEVDDPEVWQGVNPASWVTERYLRTERNKPAMREPDFRRWHLNQWTTAEDPWLPIELWDACLDPTLQLLADRPVGAAVDMGERYDSSAVCWAQRQEALDVEEEEDLYVVRSWGIANPYPPGHNLRDSWTVDTEEVRAQVRQLHEDYPVAQAKRDKRVMPGPAVAYDPWHFRESAEDLDDDGVNMVEFPQNATRMGPASELLLELVKSRRLRHDGDPILRQHIRNATAKRTRRGWVIDKPEGSTRHIDRAVALAMAVTMAAQEPPKPRKPRAAPVGF